MGGESPFSIGGESPFSIGGESPFSMGVAVTLVPGARPVFATLGAAMHDTDPLRAPPRSRWTSRRSVRRTTARGILRPERVQSGPIRLEEGDPRSTCEPITLHRSGQAVVLRPDRAAGAICPRQDCGVRFATQDRLFPLFRLDIPGLTAMCDYIVFCQEASGDDERIFVLLCELKSQNVEGSRIQVENGRLLADYVMAMAAQHCAVRPRPEVTRRGIVFSPKFGVPKGSLLRTRARYAPLPGGSAELPFAYYGCGREYPLQHFCT